MTRYATVDGYATWRATRARQDAVITAQETRSRMAETTMDIYLNDHLAGAMLGSDLAEQIRDQHERTPLGDLMRSTAPQTEEDRRTLITLMQRMNTPRNPVKQATAWAAEKASRVKFRG